METLPRRLQALEDALRALPEACDAMTLGELDGFIAGLLVCPIDITSDEWLGLLWRDVSEDGTTRLVSDAETAALSKRILDHYRLTSLGLRAREEVYAPVFYLTDATDAEDATGGAGAADTAGAGALTEKVIWETWAAGFGEAMHIRMDSWEHIARGGDEQAREAFKGLFSLIRIASRPDLDAPLSEEDAELALDAPDMIPLWTEILFDWRMIHRPDPVQMPVQVVKIGRNDPCPCSSGRKYKKCCGASEAA